MTKRIISPTHQPQTRAELGLGRCGVSLHGETQKVKMLRLLSRGVSLFSVILLVVIAACPSAFALKMNIDPPRVVISVKPGEETTGFVSVLNYDEEGPIHVKAYVQDLVYLPDGSNDFLPLESTPWSIAEYLKIGPTEFDIGPGQQEMVRYIVTVPEGATGGFYGVVFFEVATPPSQFTQAGANVNVRLGSIFLLTASGTEDIEAKLKSITITEPNNDVPLTVSASVYNGGNIIARPFGTVKIIDEKEVVVAEFPINEKKGGIFPKTNGAFQAKYEKNIEKGTYFAQVVLDYGGDVLLGGQKKFTIK